MKNYIILKATEERESFTVTIDKDVDIALKMVTQIEKSKAENIIHDLLRDYLNEHIAKTEIDTLARYSQEKKMDADAQQLARLVAMEKVMEVTQGVNE